MPREGVYANNAKNRALGRVGKPYGTAVVSSPGGGGGSGSDGSAHGQTHRPGDTRRRRGDVYSCEEVDRRLDALGVEPLNQVSKCVRAAIQRGIIELKGEDKAELDQVIYKGEFPDWFCEHPVEVKLKDVLFQSDYGGNDYEDMDNCTIVCEHPECVEGGEREKSGENGRMYLTGLCEGNPTPDCGKFHNHCTECRGFGQCIHDYRETHCHDCGRHYFGGFYESYDCPCKNRNGRGGGDQGECVIS